MEDRQNKVYHFELKNRAVVSALLRGVVAAYIVYLGYRATPLHGEPDGLSVPMAWLLGGGLMVAGIVVLVYTVMRYRRELAAAEYPPEEYAELERKRAEGED